MLLVLATLTAACATRAPVQVEPPEPAPPPPLASPACEEIVRIEVWKGERTLVAYCKRGAMRKMHIALGREDVGPKTSSNDQRTPEGQYQISGPARPGRFHLFIPIDYPSLRDAEKALAAGRISAAAYARIVEAIERGRLPPQDTALGGYLGFHGEGERWRGDSKHLDWTYGCIAVTDAEIEFLATRTEPGVAVRIHP